MKNKTYVMWIFNYKSLFLLLICAVVGITTSKLRTDNLSDLSEIEQINSFVNRQPASTNRRRNVAGGRTLSQPFKSSRSKSRRKRNVSVDVSHQINENHEAKKDQTSPPSLGISQKDLDTLKEIELYYQKILDGNSNDHPELMTMEKHKGVLMHLIRQLVKFKGTANLQTSVENLLRTISKYKTSLESTNNNIQNHEPPQNFISHNNDHRQLNPTSPNNSLNSNELKNSTSGHSHNSSGRSKYEDSYEYVDVSSPILQKLNQSQSSFIGRPIHIQQQIPIQERKNVSEKETSNQSQFSNRMGPVDISPITAEAAAIINRLQQQSSLDLLPNDIYNNQHQPSFGSHPLAQQAHNPPHSLSSVNESPLNEEDAFPSGSVGDLSALLNYFLQDRNELTQFEPNVHQEAPGVKPISQFPDFNLLSDAFASIDRTTEQPDILFVDNVDLQTLVNKNVHPLITTQDQKFVSSILDRTDGITPENLVKLIQTLDLPPSNISSLDVRLPAIASTRLTAELATAITTFLTSISEAFTTFITDLQAAIDANPLLGVLLVLGALALAYHLFQHKKGGHKGGYGGGGGHKEPQGYHRRNWDVRDRYRSLSVDHTAKILNDIIAFESWLQKMENIYEKIS